MKAWVIIAGVGEYSDRCTSPSKVYLDQARAQDDMRKLKAIFEKYHALTTIKHTNQMGIIYRTDYDAERRLAADIAAEYAAIGYDATWEDWELAEADLVP